MSDFSRLQQEAHAGATIFRNQYVCPSCDTTWHDDWSAQCDDECPHCGQRHVSPEESVEVTEEYLGAV